MSQPIVWCIGGSDSGGGAGLAADIKTCTALDVHAASVVTAVTAQNSQAMRASYPVPADGVESQLAALAADLPADAIKIGMLANSAIADAVSRHIQALRASAPDAAPFVVLDPVRRASADRTPLLRDDARPALLRLCAQVDLLTPNLPEAEWLLGRPIRQLAAVEQAARDLLSGSGARSVLIKGGHAAWRADARSDYWHNGQTGFWLHGRCIDTVHSHGSGCVLASAIAALSARGHALRDALVIARGFLASGLRRARALGQGTGPVGRCDWPASLQDLPWVTPSATFRPLAFAPLNARSLAVYPITERADHAARLMAAGAPTVQLRIKAAATARLAAQIARANEAAARHGAALFVNDHWQAAIAQRCAGTHLGQQDLAGLSAADLSAIADAGLALGLSTHGWWELARAHAVAPSYIAIGPVFATTSKAMSVAPQGIGQLQRWCELLAPRYALVAIGGMDARNAALAFAAGAHGVSMIRAVTGAGDSLGQLAELLRIASGATGAAGDGR